MLMRIFLISHLLLLVFTPSIGLSDIVSSDMLQDRINKAIAKNQTTLNLASEFPNSDNIEVYAPIYIIDPPESFTLEGSGFRLFASQAYHTDAALGPFLGVIRGNKTAIRNLTFEGPGSYPAINKDPDSVQPDVPYNPPASVPSTPQPEAAGIAVFFRNCTGFQISGCTIHDFSNGAIYARFCQDGVIGIPADKVSTLLTNPNLVGAPDLSQYQSLRNTVYNIRQASIVCEASVRMAVCGNSVSNNIINYHYNSVANAYGISFTTYNNQADVRASSGTIAANEVANVRTWIGIDVHGGGDDAAAMPDHQPSGIHIKNNTITDCCFGISMQYDEDKASFPHPQHSAYIWVENNHILRSTTWPRQLSSDVTHCYDCYQNHSWVVQANDESNGEYLKSIFGAGITSAGLTSVPNHDIFIRKNKIEGYGFLSTVTTGGTNDSCRILYAGGQYDVYCGAINVRETSIPFECTDNEIIDRSGIGLTIRRLSTDDQSTLETGIHNNQFSGTTYQVRRIEDSTTGPTDEITWLNPL